MTTSEVLFWVTREYGVCRWNDASGELPGNTNSGVCAFQQDIQKIFSCAAGDATCWAYRDICLNSTRDGTLNPGEGQVLCQNPYVSDVSSQAWCCSQETSCPTSANSINICLGAWLNPVVNMDAVMASSFAQSILGTTTMGTTSVHTNAPVFSTTTASSLDQPSSAASSLSGSSAVGSTSTTAMSSTVGSSSASAVVSTPKPGSSEPVPSGSESPHKSLNSGAIAGIVAAVTFVLAAVCIIFFLRRRRKSRQSANDVSVVETPQLVLSYADKLPDQKSQYASCAQPLGLTGAPQSMSSHDGRVPQNVSHFESYRPSGVTGAP